MAGLIETVRDIVFPPLCPVCREELSEDGLCGPCLATVRWIESPFCSVCGIPFNSATEEHRCGECTKRAQPFVKARSAVYYEGAALKAIRRYKYHYDMTVEEGLQRFILYGYGLFCEEAEGFDLLVPVPLHRRRLKERGFNQAVLVARILSRHTGIRVEPQALVRVKYTTPQVALEEKERLKNVRDAFRLKEEATLKNKRVLLVDDVMTTGATIRECAKVLKRAGAQVYALTLARVV